VVPLESSRLTIYISWKKGYRSIFSHLQVMQYSGIVIYRLPHYGSTHSLSIKYHWPRWWIPRGASSAFMVEAWIVFSNLIIRSHLNKDNQLTFLLLQGRGNLRLGWVYVRAPEQNPAQAQNPAHPIFLVLNRGFVTLCIYDK